MDLKKSTKPIKATRIRITVSIFGILILYRTNQMPLMIENDKNVETIDMTGFQDSFYFYGT
jgi:hypothetical protein